MPQRRASLGREAIRALYAATAGGTGLNEGLLSEEKQSRAGQLETDDIERSLNEGLLSEEKQWQDRYHIIPVAPHSLNEGLLSEEKQSAWNRLATDGSQEASTKGFSRKRSNAEQLRIGNLIALGPQRRASLGREAMRTCRRSSRRSARCLNEGLLSEEKQYGHDLAGHHRVRRASTKGFSRKRSNFPQILAVSALVGLNEGLLSEEKQSTVRSFRSGCVAFASTKGFSRKRSNIGCRLCAARRSRSLNEGLLSEEKQFQPRLPRQGTPATASTKGFSRKRSNLQGLALAAVAAFASTKGFSRKRSNGRR